MQQFSTFGDRDGLAALKRGQCPAIMFRDFKEPGWPASQPARFGATAAMTNEERRELEATLARLRQEHRDLDAAIEALHNVPGADILQVQRLKKRKLVLRDRITFVEDQLTPDIIA